MTILLIEASFYARKSMTTQRRDRERGEKRSPRRLGSRRNRLGGGRGAFHCGDRVRDAIFKHRRRFVVAGDADGADFGLREILILASYVGRHIDERDIRLAAKSGEDARGEVEKAAGSAGAGVVQTVRRLVPPHPQHLIDTVVDEDEVTALLAVGNGRVVGAE